MTRTDSNFHGALLSRLLWPTAILFVSTLCVVLWTITWTSDKVNDDALERQRDQLAATLKRQVDVFREDVGRATATIPAATDESTGPEAARAALTQLVPLLREFEAAFVISPAHAVLAAIDDRRWASPGDVAHGLDPYGPMIDEFLRRLPSPSGTAQVVAQLVALDRDPGFVVVARLPGPAATGAGGNLLVLERRFDATTLARLGSLHHIEGLKAQTSTPSDLARALPIPNGHGAPGVYLTWSPERPGDLMRERLVPLTIAGFCLVIVLFCAVAFYLRWVTRDLVDSQARSRELLGRDPLSGLANRMLFSERLDQELSPAGRGGDGLAVLFIDLDRFKDVNDTYGHQAGDELIQAVARRIAGLLNAGDVLARFGGDEFAIIQIGNRGALPAETLARQILDILTEPFAIAQTLVTIGASMGIALAPENGQDRETLMRLADTALYQAKSEGRNRYSFFQSQMDETIRMRKIVEEDLRQAIETDGLELHYQPLFSPDGEAIVALEALVRWPHPVRGMINPGQFIAIAEERGLIIPLGEWVLRRACADGNRWPHLRIAINVSAIQFRHRDFVENVKQTLEETGLDPSRLELELTEGVVVADADAAEAAMIELRALGVHLALDDFGTGYSSLIYLRRFAFDAIKIDRSFLESMEATGESAILVHSIVHLGRALGLTVTAEGVETREQHRFLQALGCHQLQGFLFSRPVPAHEIDRLLGRYPPPAALPIATAA